MEQLAHTAPIPPAWYWQPEHYECERQELFFCNWAFAGFAETVANPGDWLSFTVAGLPVVIRNMKGALVAFRNICSHRHAVIHPEGCGNGLFKCPYHGWTYNADGVPFSIPENERSFGLDMEARKALALKPVAVERCGRFLFVRVAEQGPGLVEWLGPMAEVLEHVSGLFDRTLITFREDWACNWKPSIEIALEGYHLPTVHPESFARYINMPQLQKSAADEADIYGRISYHGLHSINALPIDAEAAYFTGEAAKHLQLPSSERYATGYNHFLIYPNLMVGISAGMSAAVVVYEPTGPETTRMTYSLIVGGTADPALQDGPEWQKMADFCANWTKSVVAEDRVACENFQRGVRHATQPGLLGRIEERVEHFQRNICTSLTQEQAVVLPRYNVVR